MKRKHLLLLSLLLSQSAPVLGMDREGIAEGYYTITNKRFSDDGILTYTSESSTNGRFAQISNKNNEKHMYELGGEWRDCALWRITPVENGYYVITNKKFPNDDGKLTYTYEASANGRYAQVSYKDDEKHKYELGRTWRDSALWRITLVEGGDYTISNKRFPKDGGKLTYTKESSANGRYAQVSSNSNEKHKDRVSWSITRVKDQ